MHTTGHCASYGRQYTDFLTLAEVKVFGQAVAWGDDVALGKSASQSSTFADAAASYAVDGDTNGQWLHGSLACTTSEPQPWWEVDLGQLYDLDALEIWNRTDCAPERLDDFYIFVSDVPFTANTVAETLAQGDVWHRHIVGVPAPDMQVLVDTVGRYVRIQLADTDFLTLAEVKVFGHPLLTS